MDGKYSVDDHNSHWSEVNEKNLRAILRESSLSSLRQDGTGGRVPRFEAVNFLLSILPVSSTVIVYDSRKSRAGSIEKARRVGIHVAMRPSIVMTRETQESSRGSLVLGKEMRCARRRAANTPPMRPMHVPLIRMRMGRLSVERMTWMRCAPRAMRMPDSFMRF